MTRATRRLACQAGFNLIEMMFVVAIMGILMGVAVIQMESSRPGIVGDGAMRVVIGQMNQAREAAITQRRFMRVTFTTPGTMQIVREELDGTTTTISTVIFEGGMAYGVVSGLPDTPDAFGNGSAINFGSATTVKFGPDGTLVNQNGASLNGSVFLSLSNLQNASRAVTVLGSTGRIRGYRWDGGSWKLV